MFDKLVVSTARPRGSRTTRFFLATSMIYLLGIASMLIVSVIIADPKLANRSDDLKSIGISLPPKFGQPERARGAAQKQTAARPNLNNIAPLIDLLRKGPVLPVRPADGDGPPTIGPIGDPTGFDEGSASSPGWPSDHLAPIGPAAVASQPPPQPPPPRPAPNQDQRPIRLTSNVLQGKAIERHTPAYPHLARIGRVQGSVAVEVIVSPAGRVEYARAVSGHPLLLPAAVEAARRWRFQPTELNGVAVKVTAVITFNFTLSE